MEYQEILKQASLILGLYADNGGVIRTKAFPAQRLEERSATGVGWTVAQQAVTPFDGPVALEGMGAVGEFRQHLDLHTLRLLPALPGIACAMSDMRTVNGEPWGHCPRTFLKRVLARFGQQGIRADIGVEHEFLLLRMQADGSYETADQSPLASTSGLYDHASFLNELLADLSSQNIEVTQLFSEYGPGQLEFSLHHAEALQSADTICQFREMVRSRAQQQHLLASFAPKPFPAWYSGANGEHLHVSLWQEENGAGRNLFYDASAPQGLSQLGRFFIGGVLAHIDALAALTCASVNSYHRLQPQSWSSAFNIWGFDNREGAIRVPSLFKGKEASSMNLELRCSDHSGNPYLAIGGLLAAGLDGITRRLDPGEALQCDPTELSDAEREERAIRRLPTSLDDALMALEHDVVLTDALGPQLTSSYIAVKRDESAYCLALAEGIEGSDEEKAMAVARAYVNKY